MNESALVTTFEMLIERMTNLENKVESFIDRSEREKVYTHEGVFMLRDLPGIPIVKSAIDYNGVVIEVEFSFDIIEKAWKESVSFRNFVFKNAPEKWKENENGDISMYRTDTHRYFDDHLNYLPFGSYLLSKFCSELTDDFVVVTKDFMFIHVEDIHQVYDALVSTLPTLLQSMNVLLDNIHTISIFNAVYKNENVSLRCTLELMDQNDSRIREYVSTLGDFYKKLLLVAIERVKDDSTRLPFKPNIFHLLRYNIELDRLRNWCI